MTPHDLSVVKPAVSPVPPSLDISAKAVAGVEKRRESFNHIRPSVSSLRTSSRYDFNLIS